MLLTVLVLAAICSLGQSSGVVPEAVGHAPVVTAASSQYFERTYNRLVAAQPVFEPVIPVAPAPPVFVEPVTRTVPVLPVNPTQSQPQQPNIAIAVATAHAAAPVATILLPPYPFGLPPSIGFIPPVPPINVPDEERPKEPTTPPTTKATTREPEPTTPLPSPSNTDNSFAQPLPSNQNVNFNQYYAPPLLPVGKPQKLKTTVEIVPVPLQYIAPPPLVHHHHHHHHHHGHVKPIKYVHAFVPSRAKIIIRPVSAPLRIRTVRVPARLVAVRPARARSSAPQNMRLRPISRDAEPTTFRPFNRPNTKPPRV